MHIRSGVFAIAACVLAGCAASPDHISHAEQHWITYVCTDGQVVRAAYPGTDTAHIVIGDKPHTLHIAISGSGARYIGDGWQWWTKGMHDGLLAPLSTGESIASAPGLSCHAD